MMKLMCCLRCEVSCIYKLMKQDCDNKANSRKSVMLHCCGRALRMHTSKDGIFRLSSLVLKVNFWVQGTASRAVLPLASIKCGSRRLAHC